MLGLKNIKYAIDNGTDMAAIAYQLDIDLNALKFMIISAIETKYPDGVDVKQFTKDAKDANEWAHTKAQFEINDISTDDEGYDTDEAPSDLFDIHLNASKIPYSEEQITFMRMAVKERKNIALLAAAGYGKTHALKMTVNLFERCIQQYSEKRFSEMYPRLNSDAIVEMAKANVVQLCASTGKAASLLGTRTLHSLLAIGNGNGTPEQWYKKASTAFYLKPTMNILRGVHCIIIDEISMISAELLDKISRYLQLIRNSSEFCGGIQIIIVGDFAQLSPVRGNLIFKSMEYKTADFVKVQFTKCFRQTDPSFQKVLDELRFGELSSTSYKVLESRTQIDPEYLGELKPTMLRSTNAEVDTINKKELKKLCDATNANLVSYPVMPTDGISLNKIEAFRKADGIPDKVEFALGAQVMITFNLSQQGLVNGTVGTVHALQPECVQIRLPNKAIATVPYIGYKDPNALSIYDAPDLFMFMPLRLAYSITVHKAQGSTLRLLEIDCRKIFCHGQLYVAISRCTDLKGLCIKNLSRRALICDGSVKTFYSQI